MNFEKAFQYLTENVFPTLDEIEFNEQTHGKDYIETKEMLHQILNKEKLTYNDNDNDNSKNNTNTNKPYTLTNEEKKKTVENNTVSTTTLYLAA